MSMNTFVGRLLLVCLLEDYFFTKPLVLLLIQISNHLTTPRALPFPFFKKRKGRLGFFLYFLRLRGALTMMGPIPTSYKSCRALLTFP